MDGRNIARFIERTYRISCTSMFFIDRSETILYKINTSTGIYALRIFDHVPNVDFAIFGGETYTIENINAIMQMINNLGVDASKGEFGLSMPILNNNGTFLAQLEDGRIVTVSRWLPGSNLLSPMRSNLIFRQVGSCFASFHTHATKCIKRLNIRLQDRLAVLMSEMRVRIINARCSDVIRNRLMFACEIVQQTTCNQDELQKVVVHGDASLSNILEYSGEVSLIDYSLCAEGNPYIDLGFLAFELQSENALDNLIRGYEENAGIDIKKDVLMIYRMLRGLLYVCANIEEVENFSWLSDDPMMWVEQLWCTASKY